MNHFTAPGSTIGIVGGGQLGRMMAMAANRMGYRIHVTDCQSNPPAASVCHHYLQCPHDDVEQLIKFARNVDVLTYEFESLPLHTIETLETIKKLYPNSTALAITQNRQIEKEFLQDNTFPIANFMQMNFEHEMDHAIKAIGFPCIVKAINGYDGKGQWVLQSQQDTLLYKNEIIDRLPAVVEKFITVEYEISVIVSRSHSGEHRIYGPMYNHHEQQILDYSYCPDTIPHEITLQAKSIAIELAEQLKIVGSLCVEFFVDTNKQLIVNELAPRPHNSGHLSIEGHVTSQFEQHIRAICGIPFGSVKIINHAAMVNLLGDIWQGGNPDWYKVFQMEEVHVHLYGKQTAQVKRKMGHLTAIGSSPEEALERAQKARNQLMIDQT